MRTPGKSRAWLAMLLCLSALAWTAPARLRAEGPEFTEAEKAWLATKPVLRVGADPFWPPFSTVGADGKLTGIDADILDFIAKRTGIRFEFVKRDKWEEIEALAKERRIDVLTGTALTAEREKFAKFTQPYLPSAVAIITRKSDTFLTSLHQLEGRTVAVPRGHVVTRALAADWPLIRLTLTDTQAEAFRSVERGGADATVANLTSATHTILGENLGGLQISGVTDYEFDIRLAVTAPDPAHAVLDKALAAIPRRDRTEIADKWTGVEFHRAVSQRTVWKALAWAGGAAGLVVLLLAARHRLLRRELAERRRVERALSDANESLHSAAEEKSALMQMLAHDLRGPLTTIAGTCDIMGLRPEADAQIRRDVRAISAAADRMKRLITGLLTADAIENGQRRLVMKQLDLATTAAGVVGNLRGMADAKSIALNFRGQPQCSIRADELALEQVVENLVTNAIKFTPPGGRVEVTVQHDGGAGVLRVRDTGPGVPPGERGRLFKKFSRLSVLPTGGESSMGLGLMLVKHLVEAMNGTVAHEPGEDTGSVFVVHLRA